MERTDEESGTAGAVRLLALKLRALEGVCSRQSREHKPHRASRARGRADSVTSQPRSLAQPLREGSLASQRSADAPPAGRAANSSTLNGTATAYGVFRGLAHFGDALLQFGTYYSATRRANRAITAQPKTLKRNLMISSKPKI
eukprot:6208534-Pleurochrysis_carterae.AAC.1